MVYLPMALIGFVKINVFTFKIVNISLLNLFTIQQTKSFFNTNIFQQFSSVFSENLHSQVNILTFNLIAVGEEKLV